ncbi:MULTISPECIES: hypothetical protein [Pseudofrankia]|uniref:hypothetical protein n=1 Tax=Pseudofrankia TaxID=2994363 RepID=UPI000234CCDC|nr:MULTISPECIES: hypothetical protein [Pseudofrankia]OHV34130.1 ABC transporter permease [Pseudofrankia sp. EUN1h]
MNTAAPTASTLRTAIKVARYHLLDRVAYLVAPGAGLVFAFTVDVIVVGLLPSSDQGDHSVGGLAAVCVVAFVIGLQSITKGLSFGLALGLSRRSYYLGTALLAVTYAAVTGVILTVLRAVEGATGGWGLSMRMFRLPYILDGAWYEAWLTSFVVLTLLYVYGCWWGLVYRRWSLIGLIAFSAGQVTVLLAGALATTWSHSWSDVGHFFTTLSAIGLTGVLAAVAVALMAGGFTTLRRVTI